MLMHVAEKDMTKRIFKEAGPSVVINTNKHDENPFNPSRLKYCKLSEHGDLLEFIIDFQTKWNQETGEQWDHTNTTRALFLMSLIKTSKCSGRVEPRCGPDQETMT